MFIAHLDNCCYAYFMKLPFNFYVQAGLVKHEGEACYAVVMRIIWKEDGKLRTLSECIRMEVLSPKGKVERVILEKSYLSGRQALMAKAKKDVTSRGYGKFDFKQVFKELTDDE